ncbi:MAG: BC1881 family protein [Bacillota bacterium]
MTKTLSDYTTADLVKELQKREAVESIPVQPYEKYQILAGNDRLENTGPVIMLVISD